MPVPAHRKTEDEHWLSGTQSQAAPDAPPLESGRPRCPAALSPAAKKSFRALCRLLASRRALTAGDQEILRLYAVISDRHQRAIEHLAKEGEIVERMVLDSSGQPHPRFVTNEWLKIAQDCEGRMRGLLADLGLNPMARPKVKPTKSEAEAAITFH